MIDWYTDEDNNWDDPLPPPPPPKRRIRHWSWYLLPLLIIIGGSLFWWRANQQVEELNTTLEQTVIASYQLRHQAILNGDDDLFKSLTSGSHTIWAKTQIELLEQGLLTHYQPWDWVLQPDATVEAVTIDPNLFSAEITAVITYHTPDSPIQLRQRTRYQKGADNWLASQWLTNSGIWITAEGPHLSLSYHESQAHWFGEMADALSQDVDRWCQQLTCTEARSISARLDMRPESLLTAIEPETVWYSFVLPLPLLGEPIDETSWQQVYQTYQRQLLSHLIMKQVRATCCDRAWFHQALIDKQLAQFDVAEWPMVTTEYDRLFNTPIIGLENLHRLWHDQADLTRTDPTWREVYATIDFLADTGGISPIRLHHELVKADSYWGWLQTYLPYLGVNLDQLSLHYAQRKMSPAQTPLPTQDIALLCQSNSQRSRVTGLYLHNLVNGRWQDTLPEQNWSFMAPLPDDSGLFLQVQDNQARALQGYLWQADELKPALTQRIMSGVFFAESLSGGLALHSYDYVQADPRSQWLDLQTCDETGCQLLDGRAVWSSGHDWGLVEKNGLLTLIDQNSQPHHEWLGHAPFWLDQLTFGYVSSLQSLIMRDVTQTTYQVLLSREQLSQQIPKFAPERLSIREVLATEQSFLLAVAIAPEQVRQQEQAVLLRYDRTSQQLKRLLDAPLAFGRWHVLAQNGRYLTIKLYSQLYDYAEIIVYNLETGEHQTYATNFPHSFPQYDWSADGEWLMRLDDGFIHFIAPASQDQHLLVHNRTGCYYAAWLN